MLLPGDLPPTLADAPDYDKALHIMKRISDLSVMMEAAGDPAQRRAISAEIERLTEATRDLMRKP